MAAAAAAAAAIAAAPSGLAAAGPASPSLHVTEWSEQHVEQWLHSLDFDHLAPAFREHGINGDSLVLLDDDNLQEIGVGSVGQRLSLLGEIYRLKETYDIPIEEGDYVPQSAFPTISLLPAAASAAEPLASLSHVLGAIQQRDERIAALESELSKVTIYLHKLQQDFAKVCQLVDIKKPLSCDAPPIFPFNPPRTDGSVADPVVLLNPTTERSSAPMGLSASQPGGSVASFGGSMLFAPPPASASSLSAPVAARVPASAGSTSTAAAAAAQAPYTARTPSTTSRDGASSAGLSTGGIYSGLSAFGGSEPENAFRSFRVTLDDPCYRVLPAALKKYKINDDWKKYALFICHGNTDRCVTYEEKPLLLFQKLKEAKQNPIFMLRHIRDVKNPIALAKAKAEARKQNAPPSVPEVKVPIRHVQGFSGAGSAGAGSGGISTSASSPSTAAADSSSRAGGGGGGGGAAAAAAAAARTGSGSSGSNSKVAQTVARFEQSASGGSSPRPSTAPATGGGAAPATPSRSETEEGDEAVETLAGDKYSSAPPKSAPAESSSSTSSKPASTTSSSAAAAAAAAATPTHTMVPLGSPEWATAMAVRALRNGHDPDKPVVTGAATRLPASTTTPTTTTTTTTTSASAGAGAGAKAGASGGANGAGGTASAAAGGGAAAAAATPQPQQRKFAIAIYPYPSERHDEFDVELGDTFVVLSKIHGWWAVERDPRADGEGDGQWVEVEVPPSAEKEKEKDKALSPSAASADASSSSGRNGSGGERRRRVKVVRTGWVPAGCLLEMSQPLAVAVPSLPQRLEEEAKRQIAAGGDKAGAGAGADSEAGKAAENGDATDSGAKEGAGAGGGATTEAETTTTPLVEQPPMATFPIPPTLITSPSTPGIMLMDYTSPPEDRLVLKKNDGLRVFKRYSHWSYCVQEGGSHGRGWVPSWYIGKASPSSATSSSSRRTGGAHLSAGSKRGSSARSTAHTASSAALSLSSASASAAGGSSVAPSLSSSSSPAAQLADLPLAGGRQANGVGKEKASLTPTRSTVLLPGSSSAGTAGGSGGGGLSASANGGPAATGTAEPKATAAEGVDSHPRGNGRNTSPAPEGKTSAELGRAGGVETAGGSATVVAGAGMGMQGS